MRFRHLVLGLAALGSLHCGSQTPASPTPDLPPIAAPADPTPSDPPVTLSTPPFDPNVIVGAGDIADCAPNAEATARLLDSIGGTVITLGDNAYPRGTAEEFRICYEPTWGRHKARTRPSPGNHDYESPGAAPYYDYFGASAGLPGEGYYSYQVGSWLVLSLNSNANIEAQVKWLNDLFDRETPLCTLAYFHHPRYSSGPGDKVTAAYRLWDTLYRRGADVVLSGHDHLYERLAPQDERGQRDPDRGMRQFVVGTGGGELDVPQDIERNSERLIADFGVLKMTLSSGGYQWDYVAVSGPSDSGSGRCH
ncbi:MAG: metallophosphoesterase [Vicinamibacterales bacterium]